MFALLLEVSRGSVWEAELLLCVPLALMLLMLFVTLLLMFALLLEVFVFYSMYLCRYYGCSVSGVAGCMG